MGRRDQTNRCDHSDHFPRTQFPRLGFADFPEAGGVNKDHTNRCMRPIPAIPLKMRMPKCGFWLILVVFPKPRAPWAVAGSRVGNWIRNKSNSSVCSGREVCAVCTSVRTHPTARRARVYPPTLSSPGPNLKEAQLRHFFVLRGGKMRAAAVQEGAQYRDN